MNWRPRLFCFVFVCSSLLGSRPAFSFQILSALTDACHEKMTLGVLGYGPASFRESDPSPLAAFYSRMVAKASAVGVPADRASEGMVREMENRFQWSGLSQAQKFVLASFVAGVRSPDTNGFSIVDINHLRGLHIRNQEQSAHILRRSDQDGGGADLEAIEEARARILNLVRAAQTSWNGDASLYRDERWTFAFYGEHTVRVMAAAYDLGVALHVLQDAYAHVIRDDQFRVLAISNFVEAVIGEHDEASDGPAHSERMDRCAVETDDFDRMRVDEARERAIQFLNAVDSTFQAESYDETGVAATLDPIFTYQPGCHSGNAYCGSVWYQKAREKFTGPFSVSCGLMRSVDDDGPWGDGHRPGATAAALGSVTALVFLLLPLLLIVWFRSRPRRPFSRVAVRGVGVAMACGLFLLGAAETRAFEDPTGGKPFFPWLWEDQFLPTARASADTAGLIMIVGGVTASAASYHYDNDVYEETLRDPFLSEDAEWAGAILGSGGPGIAIALTQLVFDQKNGLMHGRAIAFTSLTHITAAFVVRRERPGDGDWLSFPSGHVSSTFASAASLAYAYGPWVGVPAYAAATFVAAARISDRVHWLSDTVAAAFLGVYWARASAKVADMAGEPSLVTQPVLVPGGALMRIGFEF